MGPIVSSATPNRATIASLKGCTQAKGEEIFEATKKSGAEVIRLKGGAGRAVGVSIMEVVHAAALDSGALLPVSSMQTGNLGIKDICLSLPTRVGRNGVVEVLEPKVSDAEKEGLLKSAESLASVWAQIQ
jgi:L-lactate dehydrogenase